MTPINAKVLFERGYEDLSNDNHDNFRFYLGKASYLDIIKRPEHDYWQAISTFSKTNVFSMEEIDVIIEELLKRINGEQL